MSVLFIVFILALQSCGLYVVTPHLMTHAKRRMAVMHPLPRVDEIRQVNYH